MPRQTDLTLRVAAGILRNAVGEVLLTERIEDGPFRGLWEFPGGKIAIGESAEMALTRELQEELGIEVLVQQHFKFIAHSYADRTVELDFFFVDDWRGEPTGLEGQGLRWVSVEKLDAAELLPADAPLIVALREQS